MKYTIYTDGSYSTGKKIGGCSYLILTPKLYIHSASVSLDYISSNTEAETIAPALGTIYLIENNLLNKDDVVEFNIDCFAAINLYKDYLESGSIAKGVKEQIKGAAEIIKQLSNICKVEFNKVKAHKDKFNPNTYVDRLAKIAIRR